MPSMRFALFLITFGLIAEPCLLAQQPSQSSAADIVIVNANVLVCNQSMTQASALAESEGRIIAVGGREAVRAYEANAKQVIDADGKTLTPGFIDSHLHFIGLGQSLQQLDLSQAQSWEEIVAEVERASKLLPKGTWIEGRGWHQSKWKQAPQGNVDGYPNHAAMSAAVPDHPVVLTHASGHANFANQAAMKLAGVDRSTSDPAGGELLKDTRGEPIGVFRENAQELVWRAKARSTERMSDAQLREVVAQQLKLAGQACLSQGITCVHDAGSSFATARLLKDFASRGELPVRMSVMIREDSDKLAAQMSKHRFENVDDGFLNVRSVKASIDGALGSHGAWLLQSYSDLATSAGLNTLALDELERIAVLCKQHQWQLCVHAIGDRANREVLDVYERVLGPDVKQDHRWRIEHAQHLSPDDIPRFGKLGVIPAMQANHCTSDAGFVPTRLGERRSAQGAYAWRSLIDNGAIIPNGTDAPVERVDPRASLFAAATRQLPSGDVFYASQCMTRKEALLSYTLWPAVAAFQDSELGSLEVGKRADLVLWDVDLLKCDPADMLKANVELTILAGKVAHTK
ncbi:MAG: amidohydrolase [Pirellulaceae bacterium]|nr:amidohydrolase [Pirellulaceae bacterium]